METRQRYRNTVLYAGLTCFLLGLEVAQAVYGRGGFASDAGPRSRALSVAMIVMLALLAAVLVRDLLRFPVMRETDTSPPAG